MRPPLSTADKCPGCQQIVNPKNRARHTAVCPKPTPDKRAATLFAGTVTECFRCKRWIASAWTGRHADICLLPPSGAALTADKIRQSADQAQELRAHAERTKAAQRKIDRVKTRTGSSDQRKFPIKVPNAPKPVVVLNAKRKAIVCRHCEEAVTMNMMNHLRNYCTKAPQSPASKPKTESKDWGDDGLWHGGH